MERSIRYDPAAELKTPDDITAYLKLAMEDENDQVLLLALRNATTAIGGMPELSRRTGLSRELCKQTKAEGRSDCQQID